ncbi:Acg family FMN-binding oxidoreductase [Mycobacteroides salmoniphilum]|uniref:Acg family FMN-binding oxidoreductase n=1 Tax=Mycobacteroides salmoniphilum TaxID=404941 RepID=UPI000991E34A|nr:NAD(P)H nitroreductase [Mycobacteroides salmoniphilum]
MSARFPDSSTIRAAITLANRAPSIHNSQPWKWQIGDNSLHLWIDQNRHLVHTDPDARDLIVSCGAALNHCAVALTALGWSPWIHRFPNPAEPDHVASIEVRKQCPGADDLRLAAAITRRRTDRRHFSSRPVTVADVSLLAARAARMGAMLRRVRISPEVKSLVTRAAAQHAQDPGYLSELSMWSGRHASPQGVPARNIPAPEPVGSGLHRRFAAMRPPSPSQNPDTAAEGGLLLAVVTSTDDRLSRLRAGEAASLVLLTASNLGIASCLVTEVLEIPETRDALRDLTFDSSYSAQMLLWIGWAPIEAGPLPETPRRPVEETVTLLDGASAPLS